MNLTISQEQQQICSWFLTNKININTKNSCWLKDKVTSCYRQFVPQVADAHKPEILTQKTWSDIRKARYITCGFTWFKTACVIAGLSLSIFGTAIAAKHGFFDNAIKLAASSSRSQNGELYFFPIEIITAPLGGGLLVMSGALFALPALIGMAVMYGLNKLQQHLHDNRMEEATHELTHFMTQLAYQMKEETDKDPRKLETLRFNIFVAQETYLKNGFSEAQAEKILQPLLTVAYDKDSMTCFRPQLDLALIIEEIRNVHTQKERLIVEIARLEGIVEAAQIRTEKQNALAKISTEFFSKLACSAALICLYDSLANSSSADESRQKIEKFLEIANRHSWKDQRIEQLKEYHRLFDSFTLEQDDKTRFIPSYFKHSVTMNTSSCPNPSLLSYIFGKSLDKNQEPIPGYWEKRKWRSFVEGADFSFRFLC